MDLRRFMKIPGEVSLNELKAIAKYLPKDKHAMIVELGSLYGRTSAMMASQTEGKVVSVENFCVNETDTAPYFKKKILPKYKNITLMEGTTNQIAAKFPMLIDFLFIDADHQDNSIFDDCTNWLPKVESKGIVCFHDYNNHLFPAVNKRVKEFTSSWEVLAEVDTLIIKRKP